MSTPHIYTDETLALIEQATREIAAEQAATTDTSAVDNGQLAGIFAHLQANADAEKARAARMQKAVDDMSPETRQRIAERLDTSYHEITGDPQWAGPSLPHPTEATSDEERAELEEGWDNWQHGIDPNQIHEGHYDEAGI